MDKKADEKTMNTELEKQIPKIMEEVKLIQMSFEQVKQIRDMFVEEINKKFMDAKLGHLIHLRDDGTINYETCCRSCLWSP
jgi:hexokinase